jgi:hypothetical protein
MSCHAKHRLAARYNERPNQENSIKNIIVLNGIPLFKKIAFGAILLVTTCTVIWSAVHLCSSNVSMCRLIIIHNPSDW